MGLEVRVPVGRISTDNLVWDCTDLALLFWVSGGRVLTICMGLGAGTAGRQISTDGVVPVGRISTDDVVWDEVR
eukprot:331405-Rhodomonas_salina.1